MLKLPCKVVDKTTKEMMLHKQKETQLGNPVRINSPWLSPTQILMKQRKFHQNHQSENPESILPRLN